MLPPCFRLTLAISSTSWLVISTIILGLVTGARCMTDEQIATLRQDARYIFYHGFDNYHKYAFPEDELRPISCAALTRDRANPAHIEVNDVLGNYSLTVIDSLSTLAILASRPTSDHDDHDALQDFQYNVAMLVEEYGDGSDGPAGQGRRARGFDLDSKVQLFETTIRGLGGLLSAHQFAVGDLPIRGYAPDARTLPSGKKGIPWNVQSGRGGDFVYDGQLLRLAYDMGKRLLPAFHTPTGIPYPRINLRHGIPFYQNSPLNDDAENGKCDTTQTPPERREVTETCSAGAGSLVLEFTVLSRLTGDMRFEKLAKKAFAAVWERRTGAGLIGAGIDAETGQWISPYTGIGAGIDSFFEYAFKSHILLSGLSATDHDDEDLSATTFLRIWDEAHEAIKRHVFRRHAHHPHYAQNDMYSGGPRFAWIDSLSAFYPGLLVLAGETEEATRTHLLYTALWNRYGALPERWNVLTGDIDSGLRWWGGRPEFIESTWYLYRASGDQWYLHVGEMALRDIKRRSWTPCGWAGLQDVHTGEQTDRMESFFLGETAKYLFLLFDPEHPLNHLDGPFVFTTEGHPLIVPRRHRGTTKGEKAAPANLNDNCPVPKALAQLTMSAVVHREDIFHAAYLARLHESPSSESQTSKMVDSPSDTNADELFMMRSPTNRTFFPWTIPSGLIPVNGICAKLPGRQTIDLSFPVLPGTVPDLNGLQRIEQGILINSISGLRLSLILDDDQHNPGQMAYRVYGLSTLALGRDESIWMGSAVLAQLSPVDPNLSRNKEMEVADLLLDIPVMADHQSGTPDTVHPAVQVAVDTFNARVMDYFASPGFDPTALSTSASPGEMLLRTLPKVLLTDTNRLAMHLELLADQTEPKFNLDRAFREAAAGLRSNQAGLPTAPAPEPHPATSHEPPQATQIKRFSIPAMLPSGPGAAPLPSLTELNPDPGSLPAGRLTFRRVLVLGSDLCPKTADGSSFTLPDQIPQAFNVIVVRRGGCSFGDKLSAIPSFPPSERSLKLVVVVSFPEHDAVDRRHSGDTGGEGKTAKGKSGSGIGSGRLGEAAHQFHIRPHLDRPQLTPVGTERRHPVPLVMVGGGAETWDALIGAAGARASFKGGQLRLQRRTTIAGTGPRGAEEGEHGWTDFELGDLSHDDGVGAEGLGSGGPGGGVSVKRRFWFASNGVRISNLHVA